MIITTHLCPGLHGWDSVCQVHQAHQQGSHHLVQQECPHHSQEWIFLPGSEAGRSEVRNIVIFPCLHSLARPTHLIECHVSGHFMAKGTTEEGEVRTGQAQPPCCNYISDQEIPYHLASMAFGSNLDGTTDYIQPFWPIMLSHKIDESSPLYSLAPRDFQAKQFEIIVTVEGVTPETGCSVQVSTVTLQASIDTILQVRTSYLPSEILWGQRFEHSTVDYDKNMAKYAVSYYSLNNFIQDRTPR